MAKSNSYDTPPARYPYASDDDLKRWYQNTNTFGKRLSSVDGLTRFFFLWSVGIIVIGSLLILLTDSLIGAVVVGVLLALPVLSFFILSISILSEVHSKKKTNQRYLNELQRRDALKGSD